MPNERALRHALVRAAWGVITAVSATPRLRLIVTELPEAIRHQYRYSHLTVIAGRPTAGPSQLWTGPDTDR